jgi:hypothetical protein
MSTDHNVLLEDDYLQAAKDLAEIAATRKRLDAREKHAREIIEKHLSEGETGVDSDGVALVTIRPGAKVWNEAAARANLPGELLASIEVTETVTRLDRQKAKDTFAPAIYDLATKQNKASVVVL